MCEYVCVRISLSLGFVCADKAIERGERIEILRMKSESLSDSAGRFVTVTKSMKRIMRWRKIKLTLAITVVAIVVLWLVLSFIW